MTKQKSKKTIGRKCNIKTLKPEHLFPVFQKCVSP